MTRALGLELASLFWREGDAIQDAYAWPPKRLADAERSERDRLIVTARRIAYRSNTVQGADE